MKIGFEASSLRGRRTGIQNYCYNILLELSKADPELAFLSAELRGWRNVWIQAPCLEASAQGGAGITGLVKSNLRHVPGVEVLRLKLRQSMLRLVNKPDAIDLFHAFNYIPPFDLPTPTLPVIYDLSFVRYPELHPKERVRRLSRLPQAIHRAELVHTISEFSKREIIDVFGYPKEKIFVAYPAAAQVFRPLGPAATLQDLKQLDLIPDRYLLAVGTLEPRKNLRTLISAYSNLSAADRAAFPLVIVGGKGWGDMELPASAARLVNEGSIRFLGFVDERVLRSLYEGTRLMLYASLYEGFGMPVVEAMACGAQVAHSANTSMDEITDDPSDRVPAQDVDAWTLRMRKSISADDNSKADLRGKLVNRARLFNWSDSAEIVREAYDTILGK